MRIEFAEKSGVQIWDTFCFFAEATWLPVFRKKTVFTPFAANWRNRTAKIIVFFWKPATSVDGTLYKWKTSKTVSFAKFGPILFVFLFWEDVFFVFPNLGRFSFLSQISFVVLANFFGNTEGPSLRNIFSYVDLQAGWVLMRRNLISHQNK